MQLALSNHATRRHPEPLAELRKAAPIDSKQGAWIRLIGVFGGA
jgi:hypothetical protein